MATCDTGCGIYHSILWFLGILHRPPGSRPKKTYIETSNQEGGA